MANWGFDSDEFKDKMNSLNSSDRLRIFSQVINFKLDELEADMGKLKQNLNSLQNDISKIQSSILMREIEAHLKSKDENNE